MAERRRRREVCLEYAFDRLFPIKLQQAYELLVPDRVRIAGEGLLKGERHEERCDLRQSLLRSTEARTHDCEPDSSVDRLSPRSTATTYRANGS